MPSVTDIVAILIVLALPVLLIQLLARLSGWTKLARAYRLPSPRLTDGRAVRFQNAQVGPHVFGGINNGLNIHVHEMGLRFSVCLVGVAYRAFFVPWEEISIAHQSRREVQLTFERVPDVPLRMSKNTFDRIMALAPK